MSQLQVTGEAKIRAIQGPVVANSGVITALDGVASQYVRGDGTLANFPTSGGGGGGSVSYYLNGSVNQGNINGSVYYQMSKTPVIGSGTNFSIANNDLIAQFITDANDPSLLEIPAGNWNLEMYFSASSSGGNPSFYVELYKYNTVGGFTLISSSSATPEGITNGTTIDLYTTALAVPSTALTVTDRIMLRIFVNNSGRTITLHTENSHLCQVITTFSTGITALNGLTKQVQYLAVGTSGTDFNIVSSGSTHTFNIPSADGSNRGLVTTGTQSFGGNKSFGGTTTAANLNVSGVLTVFGNLSNGTFSYTLPSAAGQLALISQIPSITGTSYIVSRFNLAGTALENSSISDTGTYTGSPTGQVTINSRLAVNNFTELNRYLSIAQNPDQTWVPPTTGVNIELFFNSVTGIPSYAPDSAYIRARKASDDSLKRLFVLGSELILNQNTSGKTLINKQGAIQTTTKLEVAGYARFDNSINVIGAVYLNATDASQDTYFQAPSGNFSLVTSGTILLRSGANTGVYVADTGFVGINGATPTVALTVSGAGSFTGDLTVNGLINNTYSNNTFLGLNIRNTNTGDNALSGISIQNAGGTTVGQINYVSTVYANPTLRNTLLINTVFDNKLAFGTNSGGGDTRADIYFTVNPAFTLDVNNPNQIHILGTSRNVIINYSGTDFGAKFQVNGTTRLSDALTGTSANFSSSVTANSTGGVSGSFISNTFFGSIDLENTGGTVAGKWNVQSVSGAQVGGSAGSCFGIYSYTASAYRLFINSLGNVAVGTINPIADALLPIQINAVATTGQAYFASNNNGSYGLLMGYDNANGYARIRNVSNTALTFETNNSEKVRITSTGAVGIGTTSPATFLHVNGATAALPNSSGTTQSAGNRVRLSTAAGTGILDIGCAGGTGMWLQSTDLTDLSLKYPLLLNPNGGNVGIGTSSPIALLNIYGSTHLQLQNATTGSASSDGTRIQLDGSNLQIINRETADTILYTADTERMRITSGGNVLIGTTTAGTDKLLVQQSGVQWAQAINHNNAGAQFYIDFRYGGGGIGSIQGNNTSVSYITSSDYRLKEDFKEIKGLEKLSAIKVYDFKWKVDGSRMDGVIAHELAEVLPYAVSGEKDGEQMQGVDYSKIVPILIKAIQEQQAQIEELKQLINNK